MGVGEGEGGLEAFGWNVTTKETKETKEKETQKSSIRLGSRLDSYNVLIFESARESTFEHHHQSMTVPKEKVKMMYLTIPYIAHMNVYSRRYIFTGG